MAGSIARAAERFGVSLVSMYDVFNGPGHDEDPRGGLDERLSPAVECG